MKPFYVINKSETNKHTHDTANRLKLASVTGVLLNHVLDAYLSHPELPITDANCASSHPAASITNQHNAQIMTLLM